MRTFRCSLLFILALLCVSLTRPVVAQAQNANPDDAWLGTWSVEGDHFRPIFRFKRGEDGDVTVRVLDGLNHWMQLATTGRPNEISQIETTIAPELMDVLTDWIQTRTSAGE